MADRILLPSLIPTALWKDATTLQFSPELVESYRLTLESKGLLSEALTACAQSDVGGESDEETAQHFARNFSGSCGRVQLALLDPLDQLQEASDLFVRAFAGGSVGLLDIPCGSGAAAASTLATVATLRENAVMPRLPLDVYLVAGDISESARENARELLERLRPYLERQAIFLHVRVVDWNVVDAQGTRALLHEWMQHARDCREYFVIAANFSGFLKHSGNFKRAVPQLEHIFGWAALRSSSVVWLEPGNSGGTGGFWDNFKVKLWKLLTFFGVEDQHPAPDPLESSAKIEHPLRSGFTHRVNLSLIKLVRNAP